MQVIGALIAGVRGAENGSAYVYRRGTSTPATVYADYDGSVVLPQPLTLDSYGGTEVYVNEETDVRVANDVGTVVRSFSPMQSAASVEYVGSAFTGRRYSDALSGANQPTTVQAILDLWKTSAGALDFNVLFAGVSTRIHDALGSIAGIFFNVKSPEFGAVGDGTTDDTVAVQNALNAAGVTKGIVLFPAGTYKIAANLHVPVGVSLWGVGAEASVLSNAHATEALLVYGTTGSTWLQEIRNLGMTASVATTGPFVSVTSARILLISGCVIGETSHTGDLVDLSGALFLYAENTIFAAYTSGSCIDADFALAEVRARNCTFSDLSTTYNGTLVKMRTGVLSDCKFNLGQSTGTATCVNLNQNPVAGIVNCDFQAGGASPANSTGISITNGNNAATNVYEVGNRFSANFFVSTAGKPYIGFGAGSSDPQICSGSRDSKAVIFADDTASVDILGQLYAVVRIQRNAAGGAQAITSSVAPPGAYLVVVLENKSGGALGGAITFSTGFYSGTPAPTLPANNKLSICMFCSAYSTGGTPVWVPVGAFQNNI